VIFWKILNIVKWIKLKCILTIFLKMFQRVEVQNLQINKTYIFVANNYLFKCRFKGFRYLDEIKMIFEPSPHLSLEFDKVHNITCNLHFNRTNTIVRPIYQFISQNPQWKMERRSVNMIVRELIGDECFEW
jgi:hypothetical protein